MLRGFVRLTLVVGISACGTEQGSGPGNTLGAGGAAVWSGGPGGTAGAAAAGAPNTAASGGNTAAPGAGGTTGIPGAGGATVIPGAGGTISSAGSAGTPPVTSTGGAPIIGVPPPEGFHPNAMNECNLNSGWKGDEYCIKPPPADKGFQLHLG